MKDEFDYAAYDRIHYEMRDIQRKLRSAKTERQREYLTNQFESYKIELARLIRTYKRTRVLGSRRSAGYGTIRWKDCG